MWVLEKTLGDPTQMVHLNGPESLERISRRHRAYVRMSSDRSAGCMYTIITGPEKHSVGNVGYWEAEWEGEKAWETGWFVLPEFQRMGIAAAATKLLISHVALLDRRFLLAFPSVGNQPSNAICRKLGFARILEKDLEYPPESGKRLRVNVWRFDLNGPEPAPG